MQIKQLTINNFRNYQNASVNFCPSINLISGLNGQGKTNLAEAAVFLSLAKSPRTHQDKELILQNKDSANIKCTVQRNFGEINFDFTLNRFHDNEFLINFNKIKRTGQIFGNLVCVYFSPQELKIVTGSPSDRRDFCDTDISMLSETYYNLTLRYERVLSQRNKLLKTEKDIAKINDTISVWNEQLVQIAAPIVKTRKAFIEKLQPFANEFLNILSSKKEELKISYVGCQGSSTQEIRKNLSNLLSNSLEKDIEVGYTGVGPHRDDVKFELNGVDARIYSSQGQARSIVLALKLAEMKIMEEELGEKPVMVFDDVFSELDARRQKKLYACLEGAQSIFTGTNFKFKPECEYKQFKVQAGQVKELKKGR